MIRSFVCRFEEQGSVVDHPGRGAHQNIRTGDNVETMLQSVASNPSFSTRRSSSQLKTNYKVYVNKLDTIRQQKQNSRDEIRSLQTETLRSVMENALRRVNRYIKKKGGHLSDVT
ncbi:hypothetical protein TNIN_62891 [Trichonephila inaurata madagascariensis]|uniref:DUF4817 domain-containing protein n=1 Tax=Trichonephila inaurata madagascariensis TaxID=2747483 RepID=A0A8X6X2W2_9ARAC|nr:hypothetical protein TNIN_62891 [Trichonephila inaurata madagascariensis]